MKNIVRVSRILKWFVIALCIGLPIIEAGYWISNGYPFLAALFPFDQLPVFNDIPVSWEKLTGVQKLLGFLANLLPLGFSILSLAYLAQIFQAFQRLEIFEQKNVFLLKKSAKYLLIAQLVFPIYMGCISLILTFYNPVGKRTISVAFGSHQLEKVAMALAIFLIAWILKEGCKLREENMGIV
jgi:hypothetical protein